MSRIYRSYSTAFKRQVAEEYHAGCTLHSLSKQHDISRNLVRVWIEKYDAGQYDDEVEAAGLLPEYHAKIAALEQLVGRQALEIEFLKGAARNERLPKSELTSAILGPKASPSNGGAS